jgi:amidase/6-aminohexanoate-cyclic-dimer hydrolase
MTIVTGSALPTSSGFMATCDVVLSPILCTPPLRIGELNTMSQPAVPLAWNSAELPLGLMFAGAVR